MPSKYSEKFIEQKKKEEAPIVLGIYSPQTTPFLSVAKYSKGKTYSEIGEREVIARKKLKYPSKSLRLELIDYNKMCQRALEGKVDLIIEKKDSCVICEREYDGAYKICPVCINYYMSSLNSCDALRIIDGVEKTGDEEE